MAPTTSLSKVAATSAPQQLRPGDKVRVVAGQLTGLAGVVKTQSAPTAVVIAVEGFAGVYVRLKTAALERWDPDD